ncbi:MAG: imidazoleglycerol-phosphate dehydratase HisB [Clostridia bacterium]|nr:imidazoleglycerol-phosphate dehydratase HisB [Clostridia bacterium]
MRYAEINRKTVETDIKLSLDIDGIGTAEIDSGCPFLDHMLTLFARHGRFDLKLSCKGDVEVDYHHTVEDIGIALGDAFASAMGDKRGIVRYGSCILPMDESLILTAVDISGRSHLSFDLEVPTEKVGDFDTELVREFWLGFIRRAAVTLHIKKLDGDNSHHIIEGAFKSAARSFRQALAIDRDFADEIPSTKGVL